MNSYDRFDYILEAKKIKELCKLYKVPLIINDNVEIAKAIDADGVHLGQGDMEITKAREILGRDKIIGITAKTVEQAVTAERNGADYLGSGAIYATGTKSDAKRLSVESLKEICDSVDIPVVAIGGLTYDNIDILKGSGIEGIAVVSAIYASADICKTTKALNEKIAFLLS